MTPRVAPTIPRSWWAPRSATARSPRPTRTWSGRSGKVPGPGWTFPVVWPGVRHRPLRARRDGRVASGGKALLHTAGLVPVLPAPGPEMGLDHAHAVGVRAAVEAIGRGIRGRHRDRRPGPDPISRPGWQDHHHARPGRPAHPGRGNH